MKAARRKMVWTKKVKPKFTLGVSVAGTNAIGEPIAGAVVGTFDHSVIVESGGTRHRCYDSALEAVTAPEQPTQKKPRKPPNPSTS